MPAAMLQRMRCLRSSSILRRALMRRMSSIPLCRSPVLDYVRSGAPRVLFVGYGETDNWAHQGRYDLVLDSAQRMDGFVAELWNTMQAMPQYRGSTTFIITCGPRPRQRPDEWKEHGVEEKGSENVWIAVIGPDTAPLGERTQIAPGHAGADRGDGRRVARQGLSPRCASSRTGDSRRRWRDVQRPSARRRGSGPWRRASRRAAKGRGRIDTQPAGRADEREQASRAQMQRSMPPWPERYATIGMPMRPPMLPPVLRMPVAVIVSARATNIVAAQYDPSVSSMTP